MNDVEDESVDLVVTSPPYPMIEMWDKVFSSLDTNIETALKRDEGSRAFDLMHDQLNMVWNGVHRVLKGGGIACINIGDATRNTGGSFQLFPSHTIVSRYFREIGFHELPSIIWKKPSNSPNKFLGSGTLPVGAYVTLEHEYILIFRNKSKRDFSTASQKETRKSSSFFWEERNRWFSDTWEDLKGIRQEMKGEGSRNRSAAYPIEVPYRLINMYSLKGDVVLDPFAGTGTTAIAAIAAGRNSIGYEIDAGLSQLAGNKILESRELANSITDRRISDHIKFVESEIARGKTFGHSSQTYGFPVKTKPEKYIRIEKVQELHFGKELHEVIAWYS